jgi:hypothetical protein
MNPRTLDRRTEPGGTRFYLDERPVHAGIGLEMRLPGDRTGAATLRQFTERYVPDGPHRKLLEEVAANLEERWVRVRFETEGDVPVLYVPSGGSWETWTPPTGTREGDEVEVKCEGCDGAGRRRAGERCERCRGTGEVSGVVIGDPARKVPCDGAHHGSNTIAECDGGRVTIDRGCDDCDGTGKRWRTIERPEAPQGILRGTSWNPDLADIELRWPRGSRS